MPSMGTYNVLHLIHALSFGGASRAAISAAKYSARFGGFKHSLLSISPKHVDKSAEELAVSNGVSVIQASSQEEMYHAIERADIVQVNWWNSPEMDTFLRSALPPMRALAWCHVGGHTDPQMITKNLVEYMDHIVACSPYTYLCEAIQSLPPKIRHDKTSMAYGAFDFERLATFEKKPHTDFNIGYIGTVHFCKMHPRYVAMSFAIKIPNVKFIVCGSGGGETIIKDQASQLKVLERFDLRGYVSDIREVLSILDVYGYPLCEDTYAASEINLQEVMYAGIPVVAFPYGGVKHLIVNDFTGYLVNSEIEYQEAIEHLYHHPEERARIGKNAHEYANQIFGSERAAQKLNLVYEKLMAQPKRARSWPTKVPLEHQKFTALLFVESLGSWGDAFLKSLDPKSIEDALSAELSIYRSSELMKQGGITPYRRYDPDDPYLLLWSGLSLLKNGDPECALADLLSTVEKGLNHWRIVWYLAKAARKVGRAKEADELLVKVKEIAQEELERAKPYLDAFDS